MKRTRVFPSTILFLFLLYRPYALASESYFAQDFVRGLFSIGIEKPIVHSFENVETKQEDKAAQLPKKINLLVWNIQKNESLQEKPLPFSLEAYDFVLLQENVWKWSIKNLAFRGYHFFVPTFSIGEGDTRDKTGVSLLSKYKPHSLKAFHTQYYEPFIISPKSFLIAEYSQLAIINVHALNFVSFKEWVFELKRIIKEAQAFVTKKKPTIVAGDFNTWSDERLDTLKAELTKIGLQEVTFKNDKRTKILGLPLDGVFSYGFRLRDSNVFPVESFSDHNALEVILEMKEIN